MSHDDTPLAHREWILTRGLKDSLRVDRAITSGLLAYLICFGLGAMLSALLSDFLIVLTAVLIGLALLLAAALIASRRPSSSKS